MTRERPNARGRVAISRTVSWRSSLREVPPLLLSYLTIAGAALALTLGASWAFARWFAKPKRRLPATRPNGASEQVRFFSSGVPLEGWYLEPSTRGAPHPAVGLVHGWSANAAQMMPLAAQVRDSGFGALLFHARGHGTSGCDGPVTIASFAQDARAALRYLAGRSDVDASRLALVGHSIGGGAAILVAAEAAAPCLRAVVSSSAFAHPREVTRRSLRRLRLPVWPTLPLVTRIIESWLGASLGDVAPETRIHEVRLPLLLIHGGEDRFVPLDDLEALWSRANQTLAERWLAPGRRHGDILADPEYGKRVVTFLRRHLGTTESASCTAPLVEEGGNSGPGGRGAGWPLP